MNWGYANITTRAAKTVTLPTSYNTYYVLLATNVKNTGTMGTANGYIVDLSTFKVHVKASDGSYATDAADWMTIGY